LSEVNNERLKKLLEHVIDRKEQVAAFIQKLKEHTDYFKAPASSKSTYHNAFEGGLLEHSLNVVETAFKLGEALFPLIPKESIVIVGLFHDLGKACTFTNEPYYRLNVLTSGKVSIPAPYERNHVNAEADIATISLTLVNKYVNLYPQECEAIRFHDGQYIQENKIIALKESPLTLLLQWSDYYSGILLEKKVSLSLDKTQGYFSHW